MKKIAIVIPYSSDMTWTKAAENMMNLERPTGYDVKYFWGTGSSPAERHNKGVDKAQKWEADYIMFNGADHLCPLDILSHMLRRIDEGWDMVQAPVPARGVCGLALRPFEFISYRVVGPVNLHSPLTGKTPESSFQLLKVEDGPQESDFCGTGNVFMKADIFKYLKKPYFVEHILNDGLHTRIGAMDATCIFNCTTHLQKKLLFDTTVKLKHLMSFAVDETYPDRFLDKKGKFDWTPATDMFEFYCDKVSPT